MLIFVIEAVALCLLFTAVCMSSVDRTMNNLELAKLDYPKPIVQRLIDQRRVSGDMPPTFAERAKKKWPAFIVLGALIGLAVRYANGCATLASGFTVSYALWLIVDWYDAIVIDCCWFCHSKRCVIPGTEDMKDAYRDYMFHIKGSCTGMFVGLPCCLIAGLIAMLLP